MTENGKKSDVLLQANVPFVSNSECQKIFAPTRVQIPNTYLCAGGVNKTDSCYGDSGGPIQTYGYLNNKYRLVLYGVVSGKITALWVQEPC